MRSVSRDSCFSLSLFLNPKLRMAADYLTLSERLHRYNILQKPEAGHDGSNNKYLKLPTYCVTYLTV